MHLKLERYEFSPQRTFGRLSVDDAFECHTLEDAVRAVKIPKETAIPAGGYEVRLTHSPRFGRKMPELLRVKNFVGIRIHWGNTEHDTDGCILVGQKRSTFAIAESRLAYHALFNKLLAATERHEPIGIDVRELR